jgi:hypothetical protein
MKRRTVVHGVLKWSALCIPRAHPRDVLPGILDGPAGVEATASSVTAEVGPGNPPPRQGVATATAGNAADTPGTGGTTGTDDRPVPRFSPSRPPSASHIAFQI